ncbi:MAG TPA: YbaB/EbfC family nucleoid-associated protein [Actinoplanes sp.]|nr:YbaB/EbfC family nucleoid-associated protein [Actinoplanes sp.]
MSIPVQNQIEKALAELTATREALARTQRDLAGMQLSAASKGRELTVTVDSRGAVTDIVFHTGAYRMMAPAELSSLLVQTIDAARTQASEAALEAFAPLLPESFPLEEVLSGDPDIDRIFDDAVRTADIPFPGEPGFRSDRRA